MENTWRTSQPSDLDASTRGYLAPDLGRRLRLARQTAGLGLRPAARRAGISYSYLCELENGRRLPSTRTVLAIAGAYRLPGDLYRALFDAAMVRWEERDGWPNLARL